MIPCCHSASYGSTELFVCLHADALTPFYRRYARRRKVVLCRCAPSSHNAPRSVMKHRCSCITAITFKELNYAPYKDLLLVGVNVTKHQSQTNRGECDQASALPVRSIMNACLAAKGCPPAAIQRRPLAVPLAGNGGWELCSYSQIVFNQVEAKRKLDMKSLKAHSGRFSIQISLLYDE
jgi:hypothetical protein